MFPSTALFDEIDCPFLQSGRCQRPYCLYNHSRDSSSGVMNTTGLGDPKVTSANGSSHTTEDNYACLEELERINKEIEAVRSEVEKEQKRLSQYQTSQSLTQTGQCSGKYLRTTKSRPKDQNGNHLKSKKPVCSTSGQKYVVQCDAPDKVGTEMKSNPVALLKKRVAHVAKFEPASKSKAQIIVPLQEGTSHLNVPSRSQLCQRRAAILTAAVKGCQSQVINSAPKKVYTSNVHQIHQSAVQNSCVGIIPVGATLQLGTNLHFIVPEGNCALPLTLIPTTMSVQRPPQPSPPVQLAPAQHPTQPANYTPAKRQAICLSTQDSTQQRFKYHRPSEAQNSALHSQPNVMGVKRKAKVHHEVGAKVPHDVRQRYVNLFVEEFLKSSVTVQDAFEKALAEEKIVYDRSINKLKYLSIAVNALKRLKNQNILPAKAPSERDQHVSRGNVPLNTQALQGPGDLTLFEQLKEHILSEDLLQVNNFPRKHQDKADFAIQYGDTKKGISDPLKRRV
nr:Zgc:152968 [Danio rerio]